MRTTILSVFVLLGNLSIAQMQANNSFDSASTQEKENPVLTIDKHPLSIELLPFNTNKQDFCANYFKNKIVFTSERRGLKSIVRRDLNGRPYYDVYVADIGPNKNFENIERFEGIKLKKYHEGPIAFNKSGDMVFFTRNSYKEKSENKDVNLQLVHAKLENGEWHLLEKPSFNSSEYSCGQPAISPDGKWLYFISDMPGGKGGTDVYRAAIDEKGLIDAPINLGEEINSDKNEMFPFVHKDGMLLFSSNKDGGLGEMDIYIAQLKEENQIGKVLHPGAPLNSEHDDFSMILDDDQKSGYFSSNRIGKGSDDIYKISMESSFVFGKKIKGKTVDKNGSLLANAEVILKDKNGTILEKTLSNENGQFEFTVEADNAFVIKAEKESYFEVNTSLSTEGKKNIIETTLELEKDPGLSLYTFISDKKTGIALEGVSVKITDNISGKAEEFITDDKAEYIRPLIGKRLGDRGSYNFEINKEGYLSKTITYNLEFDKEGKHMIPAETTAIEKIEIGTDLSKIIEINPIYFDLGKYNIRPDAAFELDKIVKTMNENPNMIIELGSHTDARGSASSNMRLSDKRAKASAKYIADRITNPERITGKGYGESRIINKCSDGVRCSEEEHQFNRRTEFIVVNMQ